MSSDPEIDQQFAAFWHEYPVKRARLAALKAYRKAIKRGVRVVDMFEALARQKALRAELERSGEWVPAWPHASTWLNGDRWADEVRQVRTQAELPRSGAVSLEPGVAVPGALTLEQVIELERKREAARMARK